MDIFEVMKQTVDGKFKTKADVRPYVYDALEECFNNPDSDDGKMVIEKYKSYDDFVDAILNKICNMDLDEDWLDGEVFSMIENTAFDLIENLKNS